MRVTLSCLLLVAALAGCDIRSETAKREMEKLNGTPTPVPDYSPAPKEPPIDPSDVVQVDTNIESPWLNIDGYDLKKTVACTKFDRVMVNGGRNVITIKGVCRQVMINGDGNKITSDAVMEFVVNGDDETVTYSRYVNGKRPVIKNNSAGNSIEKIEASKTTK